MRPLFVCPCCGDWNSNAVEHFAHYRIEFMLCDRCARVLTQGRALDQPAAHRFWNNALLMTGSGGNA